ncbi:Histidine--tRNA ligase [Neolewinella maritima]|uniref:Histidine--tRNA ligase n=1 Tax=Neolewinella maritima TaxID=1383882 RepID=A0ABN8EYA8_9BACT|nr:histidine--tRNA ligase [Neolewinella maritima]CAH0998708.1 Histidine--tRNA ligase [Neolewinella maritima]
MKPSLPKGTRDFLPHEVRRRNYIFDTIRTYFHRYGYQPIETPVMENLSTLTGKYGEEGDRLLFKVLNNGDFLSKAKEQDLAAKDSTAVLSQISKRGLRYDLTVPFARYVVMHQNDLAFPFKRYAIAPVWRADRPQKGRYNEFYQCDADVVGSDSLLYEAELTQLLDEVFTKLGLGVVIRLNHRGILAGLAELAGHADRLGDITVAVDKLDKIGMEGVERELLDRGIDATAVATIKQFLHTDDLEEVAPLLANSAVGQRGVTELREVLSSVGPLVNRVVFDVTLARGLDYYTGCIFEVTVDPELHPAIRMGSIAGGGRYADLMGIFGGRDLPGVGISFGAERIYDVLEELEGFPEDASQSLEYLVVCLDEESLRHGFDLVGDMRKAGRNTDLYPSAAKLGKMMKYADQRAAPKVIIIGSREAQSGEYSVKTMRSGEQETVARASLVRPVSATE